MKVVTQQLRKIKLYWLIPEIFNIFVSTTQVIQQWLRKENDDGWWVIKNLEVVVVAYLMVDSCNSTEENEQNNKYL